MYIYIYTYIYICIYIENIYINYIYKLFYQLVSPRDFFREYISNLQFDQTYVTKTWRYLSL